MSPTDGLVDHGGNDSLLVHRGLADKASGALTRVSARGLHGAQKLTTRGGKARGEAGEPHRGIHGLEQRQR
jgi:hypothetical protein